MVGHEVARCNLGGLEAESGNMERAHKHWTIAASAGHYIAMIELKLSFEQKVWSVGNELTAYNYSCAEMRSEARDASIRAPN
jgi:hypothetical protein